MNAMLSWKNNIFPIKAAVWQSECEKNQQMFWLIFEEKKNEKTAKQ